MGERVMRALVRLLLSWPFTGDVFRATPDTGGSHGKE